ncbi:MAG: hypothetical protein ACR2K1_11220 [Saprospiraceae bacterium]
MNIQTNGSAAKRCHPRVRAALLCAGFLLAAAWGCAGKQNASEKISAPTVGKVLSHSTDTLPPAATTGSTQPEKPPADSATTPPAAPPGQTVLVEVIVNDPCRTAPLFINDQPALVLAQIKNVKRIQLISGNTYRFRIGKAERTVKIGAPGENGKVQVLLECN